MANFNIQTARNFKKVAAAAALKSPIFSALNFIAWILAVGSIGLYFYGYFAKIVILLHLGPLFLGISALYLFIFSFLRIFYTPIIYINSENIAESLGEDSISVINEAIKVSRENKFTEIEPILLLAALEKNIKGKYMLLRAGFGLTQDISGMIAEAVLEVPRSENPVEIKFGADSLAALESARQNALDNQRGSVNVGDILLGLIQKSDVFKRLMFEIKIEEADIKRIVEWHELLESYSARQKLPFWEKESLGGIGRDWSFGYTPMLNQFARNLNQEIEFAGETHVYGRDREVDEIERILAKVGSNNALLVGEQGIGKKTIVKGFVSRIVQGKVLPALRYMQVFQVDTGAILSGSNNANEIASRIKGLFNEAARAGNIILFFDSFHALVSKKEGVGQVNTSEIILPYLQGAVRVIGATTIEDYHRDIESSPGVAAVFDKVKVKEPNEEETTKVLEEMIPFIEHRDGVFWPYQSLKEVVRVAARYIQNVPFPQKAIEIVGEVSVEAAESGKKIITVKEIDDLVGRKLDVPVTQAEGEEAKKLLNLEEFLHLRVIGQDEAISAIASAMRRARAGIQAKNRPIGVFLFLGPTGVGKTETSKALAEAYFGSEKSMIRIDMTEYQEQSSIYRLIGSPPAAGSEGEKGQLTTAVSDRPFSLVLLDEIEKAHRDLITIFLQVFDDGRLTDGTGRVVDFTNTIIIATSNAGSELIRENLLKGIRGEEMKKSLLDYLQNQGIFRPEFLNRFDAVVAFHPLNEQQIAQVAQLMLKGLAERMAEKEITLKFTSAAVQKLAKVGFDPVYGARPMRRVIQDKVENALATALLAGQIKRGSTVIIDEADIK